MTAATLPTLSSRGRVRALAAITTTAMRQAFAERLAVAGRMLFLGVLMLVFSRLWLVVTERATVENASATELLWYIAITEWIVLSIPALHLSIEEEIRSGDVAVRLGRPVSYLADRWAAGFGEFLARTLTLGPAAIVFAVLLGGGFPSDPRGLWFVVPLGALAGALGITIVTWIGLSAFWLQDVSPLYWVLQKLIFILGGLLFPLTVYPEWLQTVCSYTPFAAQLYGPAQMAFRFDPGVAVEVGRDLVIWIGLIGVGLWFTYRRALRVLDINGG